MNPSTKLIEARYQYARKLITNFISIFPVHSIMADGGCTCYKGKNCIHKGKHPASPNGFKDASLDDENIKEWFLEKGFNIGIPTGSINRIFVLDIDAGKKGGLESLSELEGLLGFSLKSNLYVKTGGGGVHYYYKYDPERYVLKSTTNILPGIDIRCEGGYVCSALSSHESGRIYEEFSK